MKEEEVTPTQNALIIMGMIFSVIGFGFCLYHVLLFCGYVADKFKQIDTIDSKLKYHIENEEFKNWKLNS